MPTHRPDRSSTDWLDTPHIRRSCRSLSAASLHPPRLDRQTRMYEPCDMASEIADRDRSGFVSQSRSTVAVSLERANRATHSMPRNAWILASSHQTIDSKAVISTRHSRSSSPETRAACPGSNYAPPQAPPFALRIASTSEKRHSTRSIAAPAKAAHGKRLRDPRPATRVTPRHWCHSAGTRPVIASKAKQSRERRGLTFPWIASSLTLLAMTIPSRRNFL